MKTILWTDDPKDYLNPGKPNIATQKLLLQRLMEHIRPGGIILLHDGILDTVAILPEFIARLRSRGYQVGTVTDLLLAQQRLEHNPALETSARPPERDPAHSLIDGSQLDVATSKPVHGATAMRRT
jgi:hypothetical protein